MKAGDTYGPYVIVRQIGHGAMGDVYLAREAITGRELALKLVFEGSDAEEQEVVQAERLGAELQRRLHGVDSRVVSVFQYGETGGFFFIDMEYIDGDDLSALIARAPMHAGFAVYVARELCDMLENLRSFETAIGDQRFHGVVHGDLKPRNIRIDRRNHVKVVDFGIAKALTQTHKHTVNVFASTAYCSPERIETQTMDTHSDLWSVGVLLYQMITQRLPFEENTKERLEQRILSGRAPDALPPNCPEPLQRIIFKMLARDASRRYRTPAEASEDLARFQRGQQVLAELPFPDESRTERTTDPDATVRTSSVPAQASFPGKPTGPNERMARTARPVSPRVVTRRSYGLLGCVGIVGLIGIGIMVYLGMEVHFWNDAETFQADLQSDKFKNLNKAWEDYEALNKRPHWSVLLWGARRTLRKKMVAAADEVISEYRDSDAPSVFEPQWLQARTDLEHALELDPGDSNIEGRLRLAQAHIDRIEAGGLRAAARQKRLNTAVTEFEEAAALLKHSPDPDLGLASLYAYDLGDVEKAQDALNRAARNGHRLGDRETAQLADAYRRRGDRAWKQSRGVTAMPEEEKTYLQQAREDYMQAQSLYARAGLFGDAARNKMQAIRGEQKVEQRLAELQNRAVMQ